MGRTAGRNMAGRVETYTHLPFFYSDLFDFSYEAVGEIDSSLEVVEDWLQKFFRGSERIDHFATSLSAGRTHRAVA